MGEEDLLPKEIRERLSSDVDGIINRFKEMRGNRPISDDEIGLITEWVKSARVLSALIDMTLSGITLVDVRNGEITFGLTANGEALAETLREEDAEHDQETSEA